MKTLKNFLKIAGPIIGLTLGSLKGYSQDYINHKYYNKIPLIITYSILNEPDLKYLKGDDLIEEYHTPKGKLIYKYLKSGEEDFEIYNKREKLIYKSKYPKQNTDIDKLIPENILSRIN